VRHTVTRVTVKLDGGVVRPGDMVAIHNGEYHGRAGRFHGKFPTGKLAVAINDGSYNQTYLHLSTKQVKRLESKGART